MTIQRREEIAKTGQTKKANTSAVPFFRRLNRGDLFIIIDIMYNDVYNNEQISVLERYI